MLAVVGYHVALPGLAGGYVGVDAFYVISGFLITGLLWQELGNTGRLDLARFYARRARRLLPAATLVSVATVIAAAVWLPPLRARSVLTDAVAAGLYAGNYRLAIRGTDYLAAGQQPSPFQHYWSLAVEEQFYLCWPVLLLIAIWLFRRRAGVGICIGLLGVGSFWLSLTWTRQLSAWAFFSLPSRAWELAVGGLLALAARPLARLPGRLAAALGWLGLVTLAGSCWLLGSTTPFPGTAALFPVLGAGAVIAAGCRASRSGPALLLGRRPLRVIGRLSYSWYLWHWPVLLFAPIVAGHSLGLLGRAGAALASLGLAALTLLLLEGPVRDAGSLVRYPRRGLVVAASLTCVTSLSVLLAAQTLPDLTGHGTASTPLLAAHAQPVSSNSAGSGSAGRLPPPNPLDPLVEQVQSALTAALRIEQVPANLQPGLVDAASDKAAPFVDGCLSSWTQPEPSGCFYADQSSSSTILLMGDSHAAQWFPVLHRYASQRRLRLQVLGKSACPPLRMPVFSPYLGRPYTECTQWLSQSIADVRTVRPRLVVLGVARHYGNDYHFNVYSAQWLTGLAETVREIRSAGVPVLVLGPIPKPPQDVPGCLSAQLTQVQRCTVAQASSLNARGIEAERAAVLTAGGQYLDLSRLLCAGARCPAIVGNLLVYRDDNHLTPEYAGWLTPVFAAEFDALLRSVSH